jgi:uncharacterized protein (DUF111 family)
MPEYDDCRRIAMVAGTSLAAVTMAAQAAAYSLLNTAFESEESQ